MNVKSKKHPFIIAFLPGGLLSHMNDNLTEKSRKSYRPGFFDCEVCQEESDLNYKIVNGCYCYWCCSLECAEILILGSRI